MKRILLSSLLICIAALSVSAQNKKAERDSLAVVKFNKAAAALESKDYVIIVDYYKTSAGSFENNTDPAVFISYEKDFVIVQGSVIADNNHTNKLTVDKYEQSTDKKGNLSSVIQARGFFITAKIEILLKKGGNIADVIITPVKGETKQFSGELVARSESKYFKRSGEI